MKAVNLIPAEERRGGGAGAAGRSGGGVYILLGTLALLVALTGAYVLAGRSVDDKKAELAKIEVEAQQAQAQANQLASYTKFSALRAKREQTVSQLAATRFDWAYAMREVSRVIPENAWLTTLTGTVAPDVQVEGANGSSGAVRAKVSAPALEISGCTTSQSSVAKMLARMKLIDGVQTVHLVSSEKADATAAAGGDSAAGNGSDCRYGSSRYPRFGLIVFYEPKGATTSSNPTAGAPQTAATPGSAPSTATPANGTATTTPSGTTSTPTTSTTPSSTPQPASGGTTP